MKTLYLHIGTPKTATKAIQYFCDDNQAVLNGKGYAYPIFPYQYEGVGQQRNAHFMMDGIYGPNHQERLERAEIVFQEAFAKLYELFETYDNIILSDEGIWNHSLRKKSLFWKRLKKEIDKGIFEIKIIVYLRRQDDYLFSWWNQQVKTGGLKVATCSWQDVVANRPTIKLDYYEMLNKITKRVGKDNVIVRVFDKNNLYGGDIFADFLNAVGLEYTEEYELKRPFPNISLNKTAVEVKRMLNQMPDMSGEVNQFFQGIMLRYSEMYKDARDISMFSKKEYAAFMKQYKKGNAMIAKEYLGKDNLFDNAYTAKGHWSIDDIEMMELMAVVMGEMMSYIMKENKSLKKEMKSLEERLAKLEKSIKE